MKRLPAILVLFSLLVVVFSLLILRCFDLQYKQHDRFVKQSIKAQQKRIPHVGNRGIILDGRARILAAGKPVLTVFVEPRAIVDVKATSAAIAEILKIGAHTVCREILENKHRGYLEIKRDVGYEEAIVVDRIFGVGVEKQWLRTYPMGSLLSHVVGFTTVDGKGSCGIELEYDALLRGHSHYEVLLADVSRRPIRPLLRAPVQRSGSQSGQGVILTLDATIQSFVRECLAEQLTAFEAESGHAIVVHPKTGAIWAMVSLPDFDPTHAHRQWAENPRLFTNHALNDQYEPGSIMKPMVMAIALDAGVISREEKIFCENGLYHGKGFGSIKEYNYRKYQHLTAKEILVKSSNIGMAKIGQRLGKKRLHDGLVRLGFGHKTGIKLSGEATGLLRSADQWTGYSVTRIPFGQEISVTAMQLIRSFCILCNQGRVVRLHLVKAFVDSNGLPEVRDSRFEVADQVGYVIDPEVAKWIVDDALTAVVNEGTGHRAQLDKWQVFGKTGTAQIARESGRGYEEGAYVASFIAGAPAGDPAVVVLVSIRRPNRKLGYTGGKVSGPVVAKIMDKTLNYLEARGWALAHKESPERI